MIKSKYPSKKYSRTGSKFSNFITLSQTIIKISKRKSSENLKINLSDDHDQILLVYSISVDFNVNDHEGEVLFSRTVCDFMICTL